MKEINNAYDILSDPVARAKYDRTLLTQKDTSSSAQTAPAQKSERHPDKNSSNGRTQKKPNVPEGRVLKSDGRFTAYDNGTVLDKLMNLMWAYKDNGYDINWFNAKSYCKNYRDGGYTDWRMPTLEEVKEGLYDATKSRSRPETETWDIHVATELIDITRYYLWTSDTEVFDDGEFAGNFCFSEGKCFGDDFEDDKGFRILPVRSVK